MDRVFYKNYLKVLSSEKDLAKSELIRNVLTEVRGAEIFIENFGRPKMVGAAEFYRRTL